MMINSARDGFLKNEGGPFGTVIVDDKGNILACEHNTVLYSKDPTAHSEINAIRSACRKINSHDLSGCSIYITAEPCPMCLGAIIWANIRDVFYGCSKEDSANIGFRDDDIYEFIKGNNKLLNLNRIDVEECKKLFLEYEKTEHKLY